MRSIYPGIVAAFIAPIQLLSQTREVTPQPLCQSCRIELSLVARLGDTTGPGMLLTRPWSVVRDSRGRIYTAAAAGETPMVFDSSGRFLRRLGRKGDGPGEYQWPTLIASGPQDSLFVFDMQQRRLTVLDADYRYVRSVPLPRTSEIAWVAPGNLIVNAVVNDPAHIGYPLHLIRGDGSLIRSFGADRPTVMPGDQAAKAVRRFAADGHGGVWTAYWTNRYRLEHWDREGRLLQTIDRAVDWFTPYNQVAAPSPSHAPDPSLNGLWVDSLGRVWTMARVADPHWSAGLSRTTKRTEGIQHFTVEDEAKAFDTIIEVIDPRSTRLIASVRLPDAYDFVVGKSLLDHYAESPDGTPMTEVWRVRLRNR